MSAGRDPKAESDRLDGAGHPRETLGLFGHARAERDLLDAYRSRRLHHAWLIGGPEGIGKATLAWRFARFILAHPDPGAETVRRAEDLSVPADHPAVARVAAGATGDVALLRRDINETTKRMSNVIRVDDVRRAATLFQQASRAGGYRICILDGAEDLNPNAANALLKLVEEPPAASLFLIVAHRTAQVLPTLRSRCRALSLNALRPADAVAAVHALGPPWAEAGEERIAAAAARGNGSVRATLLLLAGERLALDRDVTDLLDRLPRIDWEGLHRLGDKLGADLDEFDTVVASVLDWLHARATAQARDGGETRRLARLAEVWDKVRRSAREAQGLNLDKKTVLFSCFTDIAGAMLPP